MQKLFLIQGIFFQPFMGYGTAVDRSNPDLGLRVTVKPAVLHSMFAGVVEIETKTGSLQDKFGYSDLSEVILTDEKFSFSKKYEKRSDTIQYDFEKEGELWIGIFHGRDTGRGTTQCILTPITENFFDYTTLERLLR